ncbi:MAG: arsenosugar biosynthesis radical SAM protein ArsS [Proteobacteria bacterium]|nr:arsenosugar biosynthesis radical SAM protein ArsS [Pseudomonadota bacterium]
MAEQSARTIKQIDERAPEGFDLSPFDLSLKEDGLYPYRATTLDTLQVNLGDLCNQACAHCHVEAGPGKQQEHQMTRSTMTLCLKAIKENGIGTVDITGGAPEMNPEYRWFVRSLRALAGPDELRIITRTNLTILQEATYADLPRLLADNGIEVVGSLPCYTEETTDSQRGRGAYNGSITGLKELNCVGYGVDPALSLSIVYNPSGAFLPPEQKALEADYRRELRTRHNVEFTHLLTITNMPVGRFLKALGPDGTTEYIRTLKAAYNPKAAKNAMCRTLLSVGPDGTLYDCDFNGMLGLGVSGGGSNEAPANIKDFDMESLKTRRIVTGAHCYGCTAGHGSSCAGVTA